MIPPAVVRQSSRISGPRLFRLWLALALPAAILVLPASATLCLANGGPIGSTTATGRGDVEPKARSSVRLISERLSIKLDADGMHYDVIADYVLSNAGPATKVRYGVPFRLEYEPSKPLPKVTVSVADQKYPCRFADVPKDTSDSEAAPGVESSAPVAPEDELLPGNDTWCTTRISVPTGERIPLTLSYRAELVYDDAEFSKSFFKTAWCPDGDVRGRSVEVSWKHRHSSVFGEDESDCDLEAFAVFPGDRSSQEAYERRRRVTRVRFDACGEQTASGRAKHTPLELAMKPSSYLGGMYRLSRWAPYNVSRSVADAFRTDWERLETRIQGRDEAEGDKAQSSPKEGKKGKRQVNQARDCVRVTILDVEGDPAQPACISEIMPVFNCG